MHSFLLIPLLFALSISTLSAQTWQPVGSGTGSAVYALETFDGELYAGGTFTAIGGVNAHYLARWNGSAWNGGVDLISFMGSDGTLHANDTTLFIGEGASTDPLSSLKQLGPSS